MRRVHARLLVGVALLALVLTGCGGSTYSFQGGVLEPESPASPIELTDQYGNPFSLAAQQGKIIFLYFGYTTCPDACPTTLSDWIEVKRLLGEKADKVEFVMVTVDPERDTVDTLNQYLTFFDPSFIGLTGDPQTLATIRQNYGVMSQREEYPGSATGYLMNHSTSFWVIDAKGTLRLIYGLGTDPEIVAEDVEHLT